MNCNSRFLVPALFWLFVCVDVFAIVDGSDLENLNSEIGSAVSTCDENRLGSLIKDGADAKIVWSECIRYQREELVEALINKYKINPNMTLSEDGETPLHIAAEENNLKIVKMLLDAGADVNAEDKEGLTPLLYATHISDMDPEVVELLLKAGANVNKQLQTGETSLFFAAAFFNDKRVTEVLIKNGADVNHKDLLGRTALHYVVKLYGNLDIIKLLIESGADVNAVDENLMTPLHYATKFYDLGILKRLEQIGFTIEIHSPIDPSNALPNHVYALHQLLEYVEKSVLHDAFCYNLEYVRMLLSHGANVNAENKSGVTPIMYISEFNFFYKEPDLVKLLLNFGAKISRQFLDEMNIDISLLKPELLINENEHFNLNLYREIMG